MVHIELLFMVTVFLTCLNPWEDRWPSEHRRLAVFCLLSSEPCRSRLRPQVSVEMIYTMVPVSCAGQDSKCHVLPLGFYPTCTLHINKLHSQSFQGLMRCSLWIRCQSVLNGMNLAVGNFGQSIVWSHFLTMLCWSHPLVETVRPTLLGTPLLQNSRKTASEAVMFTLLIFNVIA